jgi:hypothetical protein
VSDVIQTPPAKLTADAVRAGILATFGGKATGGRYAVLFEVLNATGASHTRSADAVIMSCWPSDGLELHGVEIKVSRSDWMSELRNPKKAEDIAQHCDRWWLITSPGVVKDESEIPPAWGWRVWDGKRMQTMKAAARTESRPVNRLFLASLLRNAGGLSEGAMERARREIRDEMEPTIEKRVAERLKVRTPDKLGALLETVQAFEQATGILLHEDSTWGYLTVANGSQVGSIVAALKATRLTDPLSWGNPLNSLIHHLDQTRAAVEEMASSVGVELPKAKPKRRRA